MLPKVGVGKKMYRSVWPYRGGWIQKVGGGVCIKASGNILASENISLKLFMAHLKIIELLIFWYIVDEHHIAQLKEVSNF